VRSLYRLSFFSIILCKILLSSCLRWIDDPPVVRHRWGSSNGRNPHESADFTS